MVSGFLIFEVLAGPLCAQYPAISAQSHQVERWAGDETRGWPPFPAGTGYGIPGANRNKRSIAST